LPRIKEERKRKHIRRAYQRLKSTVFTLFTRQEVEQLAVSCGFCQREAKKIFPFEFALCCMLASMLEAKRGFASVWRLLAAAADIKVARSAVTGRFDSGSAKMMEALFAKALARLPQPDHPELLGKLEQFKQVLAQDGSVLQLAPVLKKLFAATRTNSMGAAGKIHATADVVNWRFTAVTLTGERDSELQQVRDHGIEPGTLYIRDLGYVDYDEFASMIAEEADLLMRLKSNANPTVVRVRHGVVGPRRSEGMKFQDLTFCKTHDTFDLDARFTSFDGATTDLRVVGRYNAETDKYHTYVTTLDVEALSVEEIAVLYSLRWVIELLFKLAKSSCHLDHLDTGDPDAVRTHIYSSLLAATVLSAMVHAAAESAGIPVNDISLLMVGIAAPLLVVPLMILWGQRELSYDELAAMILRVIIHGCRNQNPARTAKKYGVLRR
jgi:IS4 transposase